MFRRLTSVICLVAFIVTFSIVPVRANSYEVGDDAIFVAGNETASESSGTIATDSIVTLQNVIDTANYNIQKSVHQTLNNATSSGGTAGYWGVYDSNGNLIGYTKFENGWIDSDILKLIAEKWKDWGAGGVTFPTSSKINKPLTTISDTLANKALIGIMGGLGAHFPGFDFSKFDPSDSIFDLLNTFDPYKDFYGKLMDFSIVNNRGNALKKYLDYVGAGESVEVVCIQEYTVSDHTLDYVAYRYPTYWYGTESTHFWQMECFDIDTNEWKGQTSFFDDSTYEYKCNAQGRYHITATQLMHEELYKRLTYNVCEYWVLADTGQVIYKNCSTLAKNYEPNGTNNYYSTQLDQYFDVTGSFEDGGYLAVSPWDEDYDTVRIE